MSILGFLIGSAVEMSLWVWKFFGGYPRSPPFFVQTSVSGVLLYHQEGKLGSGVLKSIQAAITPLKYLLPKLFSVEVITTGAL